MNLFQQKVIWPKLHNSEWRTKDIAEAKGKKEYSTFHVEI